MLNRKAFTLAEMITVTAIIAISSGAIALGISSFGASNEILSAETVLNSKIKNEKVSVVSGEVSCSQTTLTFNDGFFSILHGISDGDSCETKLFGEVEALDSTSGKKILVSFLDEVSELEVFSTGNSQRSLEYGKNNGKIQFSLDGERSYKIIGTNKDGEEESLEIVFFNSDPRELEKAHPAYIRIEKLEGESFRKTKVVGDELLIQFINGSTKSKTMLREVEVNNLKIHLTNGDETKQEFSFFSASILDAFSRDFIKLNLKD